MDGQSKLPKESLGTPGQASANSETMRARHVYSGSLVGRYSDLVRSTGQQGVLLQVLAWMTRDGIPNRCDHLTATLPSKCLPKRDA